jgi:SAM-dependent methyltransferase
VRFASGVLEAGGLAGPIGLAVDFGGDRGQFFPDAVAIERRVVVELSDQPLLPGVERVPGLESLQGQPDLVIVAHVLEHLSDPRALLAEIRDVLSPQGLLYVEVPLDRLRVKTWHRNSRYASWATGAARHRFTFIPLDLGTGVARQLGWRIPRLGIVKESEHINFYSPGSLQALLESTGFEVTAQRAETDARVGSIRLGRLGMAGRPAEAS